ncbi:MAG: hypothetical protein AB8G96_06395 [Phycisphaerales bacterium]
MITQTAGTLVVMRACQMRSDFTFALPDRPGALAALAATMRAADVNLLSLRAVPELPGEQAMVGCVPESADQFRNFADSAGLSVTERPVCFVEGVDEPGALRHILEQVASADINVESIESVAFAGRYGALLRTAPADWNRVAGIIQGSPANPTAE